MNLVLSGTRQTQLAQAQMAFLSPPLEIGCWALAACSAARDLTGAALVRLELPRLPAQARWQASGHVAPEVPARAATLRDGHRYYVGASCAEFIVHARALDTIQCVACVAGTTGAAVLSCRHAPGQGCRFGKSEIALLRLLYPAFRAGVEAAVHLGARAGLLECEQRRSVNAAVCARCRLTKKERAVAQLLANGCSNGEIAHAMSVSPHTVRHHTEHVMHKLGVHSRAEAAAVLLA